MDFLPDLSILPVNVYQNAMQTAKISCDGRRREQARWHRLPSWRQSTLVCTVEFRHYAIILPSGWYNCNIARSEGMKRRSFLYPSFSRFLTRTTTAHKAQQPPLDWRRTKKES